MAKIDKNATTEAPTTEAPTTEATTTEAPTTEATTTEATVATDPKADWPTIFIPKKNKHDDQRMFSINFKEYIVKTGQNVKVPPALYKVYMNSLKAEEICAKNEEEGI